MKTLFTVLLLFSAVIFTNARNRLDNPPEKSLFWEISGNELSAPSYLFGTIHMMPEELFFIPDYVLKKFPTVDALVMEIDVNIPVKEQIAMAQYIVLPAEKSYKDYMNDSAYSAFTSYLSDSLRINDKKMERYMRLKPMHLTGLLLKDKYNKIETYELHYAKMAKKEKLDFIPLETAMFQLNLLDSILTLEEQFENMDPSVLFSEYENLLELYLAHDQEGMLELMKTSDDEKLMSNLIYKRNTVWVEKLQTEIFKEQSVFIAVGAGHLPGEHGLINQLRTAGYSVKPVED